MAKNEERLIVVTGATGRQGGAVARRLLADGWRVRAVTRDPHKESARALAVLGAEVVRTDLEDRSSLEAAFGGAYGVFAVQDFWTAGFDGEVRQGKAVADVAQAAGISHFVYSSVGGADRQTGLSHFESKWLVEQHIRNLGLPATIVRPVFFMDNFLSDDFRSQIEGGVLRLALRPDRALQMIAVEDIGGIVALEFARPEESIGQAVEIAGDELTGPQMAEALSRVIGRAVTFVQMPLDELLRASVEYGQMFDWFNSHGYQADIELLRTVYPPLLRFEDWLAKAGWREMFAPALSGAAQR
jgi:uncharacterized protein YbjT (DUF2867 family)